jgi:hypothetical protein
MASPYNRRLDNGSSRLEEGRPAPFALENVSESYNAPSIRRKASNRLRRPIAVEVVCVMKEQPSQNLLPTQRSLRPTLEIRCRHSHRTALLDHRMIPTIAPLWRSTAAESTILCPMVIATAVPDRAPNRLRIEAIPSTLNGDNARRNHRCDASLHRSFDALCELTYSLNVTLADLAGHMTEMHIGNVLSEFRDHLG